jgi:hypothetical protein
MELTFNTRFVSMCVVLYHYTKFYMPKSNGSFVIIIEPKAKYRFCAASSFLTVYEGKNEYYNKNHIDSNTCNRT